MAKPVVDPAFVVESVRPSDLRSVMRLAWSQRSPPLPGVFFEEAARQEPQKFRVVRNASDGSVVGFVLAARLPLHHRSMLMLVVRPELVGMGLRRALLAQVQEALRREGHQELTIEVPVGAEALLDFYREQGFVLVGRTQGPGGDEFVLAAPLAA